jgi:hypothetical protein
MCFSIDCPERTGGKCWFDIPMTMKDKLLVAKELKKFLDDPTYKVTEEFEKLLNKRKDIIYGES